MKPEYLYHTGIIVDDVEAAKRWYSEKAGYQWTDTGSSQQTIQFADGEKTVPMVVAYSRTPPYLELVQTIPGTIWTPSNAGPHHLGYWSDDVEADLNALMKSGAAFEAKSVAPNGMTLWAYCKHPAFGRIELVGIMMKPMLEQWFATGKTSAIKP
jgi:lactoylglutathione lyase